MTVFSKAGLRRRLAPGLALSLLCIAVPAFPHGDEDHGDAPIATQGPLASAGGGRLELATPEFALLAVADSGKLVLYLDRTASNEPILDAKIEIESAGRKLQAKATADGAYETTGNWLAMPGKHELVFTVEAGQASDLLIGTLEIPAPATAPKASGLGVAASAWTWGGIAGAVVIVGAVILLRRSRRKIEEAP